MMRRLIQISMMFIFGLLAAVPISGQSILGGAGICHVDDDPDNIADMQTQDVRYECQVAWDTANVALYVYDKNLTSGNRWISVPLSAITDTDLRLDNPRVTGGQVVFDIIQVHNGDAIVGTEVIDVEDIAPVQDVTAGTGISISNPTANDYQVENTGVVTVSDGQTVDFTKTGTDLTAEVKINNTGNVTISDSGTGLTASYADGDASDLNELQTLTVTNDATSATVTLSDAGGDFSIAEGDGMEVTRSGDVITVTNTEAAQGVYKNHAAAGVGGVAIGEYFYCSTDNTMGMSPGTKVRRMF